MMLSILQRSSSKLFPCLLLLIGMWLFYPSLSLPPSLVDELPYTESAESLMSGLQNGTFAESLKSHIIIKEKVYNLGFWLLGAFKVFLNGKQPYHWLKLLELALVCWSLYTIVGILVSKKNGWRIAAFSAVLLFLVGEVPLSVDLHSLRANWYRLHSSDAEALPWLALFAVSLWKFIVDRLEKRAGYVWLPLIVLGAVVGATIKIPLIVSAGPVFVVAILCFLFRQGRLGLCCAGIGLTILSLFGAFYYTLKQIGKGNEYGQTYAGQYTFSFDTLLSGVQYYYDNYLLMMGPAFPIILVGSLIFAGYQVHKYRRFQSFNSLVAVLGVVFFFIWFLGFTGLYTLWPSRLPRYMLIGYYGFSILAGVFVFNCSRIIKYYKSTRPIFLLAAAAGMLLPLLEFYWCITIIGMLAAAGIFRKQSFYFLPSAGASISLMVFFTVVGIYGRNALASGYVEIEKANFKALVETIRFSASGNQVYFHGDIMDERIGCMYEMANRMGGRINLAPLNNRKSPRGNDLVLINYFISPGWQNVVRGKSVQLSLNLPNSLIKAPVGFETFRKRLLNGDNKPLFWDPFVFDYIWKFYRL